MLFCDIAEYQYSKKNIESFPHASMGSCFCDPMAQVKPVQFRAQVPRDVDFLVRALVPLKNTGKDWSLSDVATEALVDWLKKSENRQLIEEHNLLQALERRGLATSIYDEGKIN
ncbi:MAG: hypothetical protein DCF22_15500 [Leptolyngbya sp.]|nr:MAG: hypothetical protein DCF22_15500 [Leptolyngbya sp.]